MSDSEEEMVAVNLGDDYYKGAYFSTYEGYSKDCLVPRSQLERWEAAKAAYESMQSEVEQVMDEQRERVRALRAERPKSHLSSFIQDTYGPVIEGELRKTLLPRWVPNEDGVPWLVTDSKIDRDEEERGL